MKISPALGSKIAVSILLFAGSAPTHAADNPEALKALLRNPRLVISPSSEENSVYGGSTVLEALGHELLGDNSVSSTCEQDRSKHLCSVLFTRIPADGGSIVFTFAARKASDGRMLIRSPIHAFGN